MDISTSSSSGSSNSDDQLEEVEPYIPLPLLNQPQESTSSVETADANGEEYMPSRSVEVAGPSRASSANHFNGGNHNEIQLRTKISDLRLEGSLRTLDLMPLNLKLLYKTDKIKTTQSSVVYKFLFSDDSGHIDVECRDPGEGARLHAQLKVGEVYQICEGELKDTKLEYCLSRNQLRINVRYANRVREYSEIMPADLLNYIPFNFVKFSDINYDRYVGPPTVDLIGLVHHIDVKAGKTENKISESKEIQLVDAFGNEYFLLHLTLWDVQSKLIRKKGVIVAIKNATIEPDEYKGRRSISVSRGSCIFTIENESQAGILSDSDKAIWYKKLCKPPSTRNSRRAVPQEAQAGPSTRTKRPRIENGTSVSRTGGTNVNVPELVGIPYVLKIHASKRRRPLTIPLKNVRFSYGWPHIYFGCAGADCNEKAEDQHSIEPFRCKGYRCKKKEGLTNPTNWLVINNLTLYDENSNSVDGIVWWGRSAPFIFGSAESNEDDIQINKDDLFDVTLCLERKKGVGGGWTTSIENVVHSTRRQIGHAENDSGISADEPEAEPRPRTPRSQNITTNEITQADSLELGNLSMEEINEEERNQNDDESDQNSSTSSTSSTGSDRLDLTTGNSTPLMVNVIPATHFMDIDDSCYQMRGNHGCYALILNVTSFQDKPEFERHGANHDTNYVTEFLRQAKQYDITCSETKLTKEKFQDVLKTFMAKLETASSIQSVIVVVMSHGKQNILTLTDDFQINIWTDIVYKFNDTDCPKLKGVPKKFLVQACQIFGNCKGFEIPENGSHMNDTIVCFPTLPGFLAWRHDDIGSHFIYALVKILMNHASTRHFEEMLKMVQDELAHNTDTDEEAHKNFCVYMPFRFNRKFYFNPGL